MDPDDWKMLTQGGHTAHDRKYKTSSVTVIRCPMVITCQTDMDFCREHNDAMAVRLRKFFFKRLTSPRVAGLQEFLKPMQWTAWSGHVAWRSLQTMSYHLPCLGLVYSKVTSMRKKRIRTMQLDESESKQEGSEPTEPNTTIDDSNVEGQSEEPDTDSTYLDQWEESLKNIALLQQQEPCHSLKQRQLGLLAAEIKRTVDERESREQRARLRVLEETKERWISLGMLKEEDAHLLQSVNGPYHPNIERSRDQYFAKKREEDQRMLEKKAREYFNNEWIMRRERNFETSRKKKTRRQTKVLSVHSSIFWR